MIISSSSAVIFYLLGLILNKNYSIGESTVISRPLFLTPTEHYHMNLSVSIFVFFIEPYPRLYHQTTARGEGRVGMEQALILTSCNE